MRPEERNDLFIQKLQQCRVVFDFNDASSELDEKQIKSQTLHEMLEYITTQRGTITESIYPEVVGMVGAIAPIKLTSVCDEPFPVDPAPGQPFGRRL